MATANPSAVVIEPLLSVSDLSRILQIPTATIYQWHYRGIGPTPIRVGKHLRWRPREVDAWLRQQESHRG